MVIRPNAPCGYFSVWWKCNGAVAADDGADFVTYSCYVYVLAASEMNGGGAISLLSAGLEQTHALRSSLSSYNAFHFVSFLQVALTRWSSAT